MIFVLKLKKPIIHVLSEVIKGRQSIRVVLLFQNATIFMFYSVLNTIKVILRQYAINLSLFGWCNLRFTSGWPIYLIIDH